MTSAIQHSGEPKANAIRARLDAIVGKGQRTYTPTQLVVERARGCHLWTVDGWRLIDFTSGVLVTNLGHGHPRFEELYAKYATDLPRNAYNMVVEVEVLAAERLVASLARTNPNAQKLFWAASGSEGIQKAMWAAQHKHPDRPILVATRYGFHGKKGLAGDVTGASSPNPNVRFVSFPMGDDRPQAFYQDELDALAAEFPDRIALFITEPYLGAAGSFHPPKWYHKMVQDWCRKHDIALIFDEVQACHGRTGSMYAFENYEVQPDLVVLGKGVANGEPAAAVVGRADLIDSLQYGEASDTYSGNPRACAAVCAVLDVFEEEGVVEQARKTGAALRERLDALAARFGFIKQVRGEGMVFGVEMSDDATAQACVLEAYRGDGGDTGVHFLGPLAGKVLRVSPPLVIGADDVDRAFGILEKAWARVKAS